MTIQTQAEAFLSQNQIAVVGVSRKRGTGNAIFKALRKRGYEVVPVNPKASEVGRRALLSRSEVDSRGGRRRGHCDQPTDQRDCHARLCRGRRLHRLDALQRARRSQERRRTRIQRQRMAASTASSSFRRLSPDVR